MVSAEKIAEINSLLKKYQSKRKLISHYRDKEQLAKIIDPILQIQLDFIILKNVPLQFRYRKPFRKGYLTFNELMQLLEYKNTSEYDYLIDNLNNLSINPDGKITIANLNLLELAWLGTKQVSIDDTLPSKIDAKMLQNAEDFYQHKLSNDEIFANLYCDLKKDNLLKKHSEPKLFQNLLDNLKYLYAQGSQDAFNNMVALYFLIKRQELSIQYGDSTHFLNNVICFDQSRASKYDSAYLHELGHAIHYNFYDYFVDERFSDEINKVTQEPGLIDKCQTLLTRINNYYYNLKAPLEEDLLKYGNQKINEYAQEILSWDKSNYENFIEHLEEKFFANNHEAFQKFYQVAIEKLEPYYQKTYDNKESIITIAKLLFQYLDQKDFVNKWRTKKTIQIAFCSDFISGVFHQKYDSNGFGLVYLHYHNPDYYYNEYINNLQYKKVFEELFAHYNVIRTLNLKIPYEIVEIFGKNIFKYLVSLYNRIPYEDVDIEKYISKEPLLPTKECPFINCNRANYNKDIQDKMWAEEVERLDNFHYCQCSARQFYKNDADKKFICDLIDLYADKKKFAELPPFYYEQLGDESDGNFIVYLYNFITNTNSFNPEEQKELLKLYYKALCEKVSDMKISGSLEASTESTVTINADETLDNATLFEVGTTYLDTSEYYRIYINRLNIKFFVNVTISNNELLQALSNTIYELYLSGSLKDPRELPNIIITKDPNYYSEGDEIAFHVDEDVTESCNRLKEILGGFSYKLSIS